jgi:hypothetical protein
MKNVRALIAKQASPLLKWLGLFIGANHQELARSHCGQSFHVEQTWPVLTFLIALVLLGGA